MNDLVSLLGLTDAIEQFGFSQTENFESIYSRAHKDGQSDLLQILNDSVDSYFESLELPQSPTLYDYLLLSLRPKDLIATFNWDPLLPQAIKRWRHLDGCLPQIAFLHGNVDVENHIANKQTRFRSDFPDADDGYEKSSLLYPVEEKNYSDDTFIASEWAKCTHAISGAYLVTVLGYSAPVTDVEARSLLLKAWKNNPTQTLGEMFIIDVRDEAEVRYNWRDFIDETHSSVATSFWPNQLTRHPRRTCEAFAFATLQQQPLREDPYPEAATLEDLENWIMPLLEEERTGTLSGKPLH